MLSCCFPPRHMALTGSAQGPGIVFWLVDNKYRLGWFLIPSKPVGSTWGTPGINMSLV